MPLDQLIPPEIFNDSFYKALMEIAKREDLSTYLEIGSSSGEGSTKALATALSQKKSRSSRLFCMEVSRTRYTELMRSYEHNPSVTAYNLSSVSIDQFPSEQQVRQFYGSTKTNLNNYSLDTVLGWLKQDLDYIQENRLNFRGIDFIKSCNDIKFFDFVLIDGSEFTGEVELQHVWGARIIALDDINSFKCFSAFVRLRHHVGYKCISQDISLRNGYAIFERLF